MTTSAGIFDRRRFVRSRLSREQSVTVTSSLLSDIELINVSLDGLAAWTSESSSLTTGQSFPFEFRIAKISTRFEAKVVWKRTSGNRTAIGLSIVGNRRLPLHLASGDSNLTALSDRREKRQRPVPRSQRERDRVATDFPNRLEDAPAYGRTGDDRRHLDSLQRNSDEERRRLDRRARAPENEAPGGQNLRILLGALRDLAIPWMPSWLARLLIGQGDFCFIAHPRDYPDVARLFPFTRSWPEPWIRTWCRFQWPFIASRVSGRNPATGREMNGWILISPLLTNQMLREPALREKRILRAIRFAEKLKCRVVGLGAFTSTLTRDGKDVVEKTSLGVSTGHCFSSAVAVSNLIHAFSLLDRPLSETSVSIVGACSSTGVGSARTLLGHVRQLDLVDGNQRELEALAAELRISPGPTIVSTSRQSRLRFADGVIVFQALTPAPLAGDFKPGAVVIDASSLKDVSLNLPLRRKDVLVIESAIVSASDLEYRFDLDLGKGELLGCLAESVILSALDGKGKSTIGPASADQIKDIYAASVEMGLRVAHFRNSCGLITEEDIARVRQAARGRARTPSEAAENA